MINSRFWLVCVAAFGTAIHAGEASWPQFRGIDGSGTTKPSKPLSDTWPANGPRKVWRVPLGPGYGEISVVGNRIYTNTGDPGTEINPNASETHGNEATPAPTAAAAPAGPAKKEYTLCADALTGKEIWRREMDVLLETEFGHGARATPTVEGDRVYVLSGNGKLMALSAKDGSVIWQVNYKEAFGSNLPSWGFSNSPIIEGDLLIVAAGGKDKQFMVALDKKTGKKAWAALEGNPVYATPTRVTVGGVRQMVIGGNKKVMGIDLKGQELWSVPFEPYVPITMPTFVPPDQFLFSSNDSKKALMLKITKEGSGFKATEVWKNETYKTNYTSSVFHDGLIYGFDVASLKCIKASDGTLVWAKRGYGKGSLILAGDKLVILSDRGQLALAKTGTTFTEIGKIQALEGRCWTAPSMVEGRVYLRNMTEMACYDFN